MTKKGLRALARRARPKAPESRRQGTLEDALLGSMGETVEQLRQLHRDAGVSLSKVDLGNGTTIDMKMPPGGDVGWEERLSDIYNACHAALGFAFPDDEEGDLGLLASQVLRADGWVLNKYSLKTPDWMRESHEVLVDHLGSDQWWIREAIQDR